MPAGKTYIKIASQTLGSNQASVTFSNLPQNYTDLICVFNTKNPGAGAGFIQMQFNGDTGSNYSQTNLTGDGTTAASSRASSQTVLKLGIVGNTNQNFTPNIFQIMNYSNGTTNKTVLSRTAWEESTAARVGLWRNTSPITRVTLTVDASNANYSSGSTFTLYGIECAKSPYAEGGDKVYSTGTHWVHEFYYSGQFVPRQNLTADYLVVAGGGGGGGNQGGGGGAGGFRSTVTATGGGGSLESALSLSGSTAYTVTIGGGGVGGTVGVSGIDGTNGNNSVFSTITSTGGGGGAGSNFRNGLNGGSGGGGAYQDTVASTGTANQGFAGGRGVQTPGPAYTGGGGGAGAVGGNGTGSAPGNGGAGVATSITGSSITYAGGGGGNGGSGGTGGSGGGGNGEGGSAATSGSTNTGSGGGGGNSSVGNGGSGIVIVRYAI